MVDWTIYHKWKADSDHHFCPNKCDVYVLLTVEVQGIFHASQPTNRVSRKPMVLHGIVRLMILNYIWSWPLCTNKIHRVLVDWKGYTDMSIRTNYQDVVTVTKQSSSEQAFLRVPIHKHREGLHTPTPATIPYQLVSASVNWVVAKPTLLLPLSKTV